MLQYLVVDLDYNEVRGIFATPQEADFYIDKYDDRGYRSAGFIKVKVEIDENGKLQPLPLKSPGEDDDEVSASFLKLLNIEGEE